MTNIFISYSTKDNILMKQMRDRLSHAGFKPWIDPAPRPGKDWRVEIDDAIRGSTGLVLIVTPASMGSVYVTYEWAYALGLGRRVVPVIFKDTELHERLLTLDRFEAFAWKDPEAFWSYFIKEMRALFMPKPGASAPRQPAAPQAHAPAGPAAAAPMPPQPPPQPSFSRAVMPNQPGQWLVIRRGPDLNGMYRIGQQDVTTLGREVGNDIIINDPEVSRFHLRISRGPGGLTLQDLGTTNGTFVHNQRLTMPYLLRPGDVIGLGESILLSYEVVG